MRMRVALLVALCGLIAGCSSEGKSSGLTTMMKGGFPLTLKLDVEPTTISIDKMPSTDQNKPQPKTVRMKLTVTNGTKNDYHGTWKDSGVARFWITDSLGPVCLDHSNVMMVETNIDLKPGESTSYSANCEFKDVRSLIGKSLKGMTLTAHGVFLPEDAVAKKTIEVKIVQ